MGQLRPSSDTMTEVRKVSSRRTQRAEREIDARRFVWLTWMLATCAPTTTEHAGSRQPDQRAEPPAQRSSDSGAPSNTVVGKAATDRDAAPPDAASLDAGPLAERDQLRALALKAWPPAEQRCLEENEYAPMRRCWNLLRPAGPSCENWPAPKDDCARMLQELEPSVAERAVRCLESHSGRRSLCDFGQTATRCVRRAAQSSPTDPTVRAVCERVVAFCATHQYRDADLGVDECSSMLSVRHPGYRHEAVNRLTDSCQRSALELVSDTPRLCFHPPHDPPFGGY